MCSIEHMSAANTGVISAYRLIDGQLVWRTDTKRVAYNTPAIGRLRKDLGLSVVLPTGSQGLQGFGTDIEIFDAATGERQWVLQGPWQKGLNQAGVWEGVAVKSQAGARLNLIDIPNSWGIPCIAADGTTYVGNQEGHFFQIS